MQHHAVIFKPIDKYQCAKPPCSESCGTGDARETGCDPARDSRRRGELGQEPQPVLGKGFTHAWCLLSPALGSEASCHRRLLSPWLVCWPGASVQISPPAFSALNPSCVSGRAACLLLQAAQMPFPCFSGPHPRAASAGYLSRKALQGFGWVHEVSEEHGGKSSASRPSSDALSPALSHSAEWPWALCWQHNAAPRAIVGTDETIIDRGERERERDRVRLEVNAATAGQSRLLSAQPSAALTKSRSRGAARTPRPLRIAPGQSVPGNCRGY
ncbi:hypothetical protein EK904_002036 [Melospiza melodia maxima]|nr:hypothetical protein EK904_002036 [Melospiza melodia maxima]